MNGSVKENWLAHSVLMSTVWSLSEYIEDKVRTCEARIFALSSRYALRKMSRCLRNAGLLQRTEEGQPRTSITIQMPVHDDPGPGVSA